jgi:hypothetical protein
MDPDSTSKEEPLPPEAATPAMITTTRRKPRIWKRRRPSMVAKTVLKNDFMDSL